MRFPVCILEVHTGPVQRAHELTHVPGTGLELPGSLHVVLPRRSGDRHQAAGDGLVAERTDLHPSRSVFLDLRPLTREEQDGHGPGEFLIPPPLVSGELRQRWGI